MKKALASIFDKEKIIRRMKSPAVWAVVIIDVAGIICVFNPQVAEQFKVIANFVMGIATAFGLLNNPDDKEEF